MDITRHLVFLVYIWVYIAMVFSLNARPWARPQADIKFLFNYKRNSKEIQKIVTDMFESVALKPHLNHTICDTLRYCNIFLSISVCVCVRAYAH